MQAEKVFKFVALRGPERTSTNVPPPLPPPPLPPPAPMSLDDDDSFGVAIRRRVDATRPLALARDHVAREFVNSDRYVLRATNWRHLLELEGPIAARLDEARRLGGLQGAEHFRNAIGELLSGALGPDFRLAAFVRSEAFREMRRNLRHSLLSTIALSGQRLDDRDRLMFWTRLFELLRVIEDNDRLAQLIAAFDRLRAAAPYDLARATERVGEVSAAPARSRAGSPRDVVLADTKLAFTELRGARTAVKRVLYEKIERFNAEPPPARITRKGFVVKDDPEEPPWIIRANDLDGRTLEVLRKHGIAVEGQAGPRITTEIDAMLPLLYARMHGLRTVRKVVSTRGVPIWTRGR